MAFDPSQPFSLEDDAPPQAKGGFDPSQPFTLEDAPEEQGQKYLSSVSDGQTPLPSDAASLQKGADAYYHASALGRDLTAAKNALFGGPGFWANAKQTIGGIANQIYTGAGNIKDEMIGGVQQDLAAQAKASEEFNKAYAAASPEERQAMDETGVNTPDVGMGLKAPVAAITGVAKGAYNAARPLVTGGVKLANDAVGDALRAAGRGDQAAKQEAELDYRRLQYEQNVEKPIGEALTNLSGLPATEAGVANVAPFLLPALAPIVSAERAAQIGAGIGRAAEGAAAATAKVAPAVGAVTGAASGLSHGPLGAIGGAYAGLKVGGKIQSGLQAAAPTIGRVARDVAGAGVNVASTTGTGLLYGLLGSEPGQEEEGARYGAAQGFMLSPLAAAHGAVTRQAIEQRAENTRLAGRGLTAYGNDPALDAQHAEGMKSLSPEDQKLVNANRGWFRSLNTEEGKPGQIYVQTPEDFAAGLEAINGEPVANAADARGYYRDNTGRIFLNADHADVPGALAEALGHEASHAAFQDLLPEVSPKAASRFNDVIQRSALTDDLQPTPKFQQFINDYTGENVDWNSLPDDARSGISKRYLIAELAAQTGNAVRAVDNPAAFTLRPEFGDYIGQIVGDFLRSTGLKKGQNLSEILPGADPNNPVPVDAAALRAARTGYQKLGAKAALDVDNPVRRNAPDEPPAAQKTQSEGAETAAPPAANAPVAATSAAEASPVHRTTQAYQDALAALTSGAVGKKYTPEQARSALDAAAANPDVPDTLNDYLFYAQTGKAPRQQATDSRPTPTVTAKEVAPPPTTAPQSAPPDSPAKPSGVKRIYLPPETPKAGPLRIPVPASSGQGFVARIPLPTLAPPTERGPARIFLPPSDNSAQPPLRIHLPEQRGEESPPSPPSINRFAQRDTAPPAAEPRDVAEVSGKQEPAANPVRPESPLTADDIARVEAEAEAAHQPNPYPRSTPESRAAKQAADLAKAKADAVADAHAASLPEGDTRVQMRVDPETGRRSLSGTHFVAGDPLHEQLLARASEKERANLPVIQDAIRDGRLLNFDYNSAQRVRQEQSAAQRQESQAASTAKSRMAGAGATEEANKSLVPLSVRPDSDGSISVFGYSPDKLAGNAENLTRILRENGMSERVPYESVNDPLFAQDVAGYIQNHQNGYKGDGSAKLSSTDAVGVSGGASDYTPYRMSPERANFVNLAVGEQPTLSEKQVVKSTGARTRSAELRDFAAANDNPPSESGEVNSLRNELNRKGLFKVGKDEGSKKVIESAFETIKPELITRFYEPSAPMAQTGLRATTFAGDRQTLAPGGKVPNRDFAGAGFLPSIVRARENIPDSNAKAAEDLPVSRIGNATLTGAGLQSLPAYHASPYEIDRFSSRKIGSGEGSQIYGYGLYFGSRAESGVGGKYYDYFKNTRGKVNEYKVQLAVKPDDLLDWHKTLGEQSAQVKSVLAKLGFDSKSYAILGGEVYSELAKRLAQDSPDKRVSRANSRTRALLGDSDSPVDYKAASEKLLDTGIPGIRYRDFFSRGEPEYRQGDSPTQFLAVDNQGGRIGSFRSEAAARNAVQKWKEANPPDYSYVMFDDSRIHITHKNGAPIGGNEAPAGAGFLPASRKGVQKGDTQDVPLEATRAPLPVRNGVISDHLPISQYNFNDPQHVLDIRRGVDAAHAVGVRLPRFLLSDKGFQDRFTVLPLDEPSASKTAKIDRFGEYHYDRKGPTGMTLDVGGNNLERAINAAHETAHLASHFLGGEVKFATDKSKALRPLVDYLMKQTNAGKELKGLQDRAVLLPKKSQGIIKYLTDPDEVFARVVEQLAARHLGIDAATSPRLHYGSRAATLLSHAELDRAEQLLRQGFESDEPRRTSALGQRTGSGEDAGGGNGRNDALGIQQSDGGTASDGRTPPEQPRSRVSGAGFLPASRAGASEAAAADAARQWREKGTDSPYFQRWFGASQARDDKGRPVVLYHGTPRPGFDKFRTKDSPAYFAENPAYTGNFSQHGGKGGTYPAYLSIQRPLDLTDLGTQSLTAGEFKGALGGAGIDFAGIPLLDRTTGGKLEPWQFIRHSEELRRRIQAAGYDGIKQIERYGDDPSVQNDPSNRTVAWAAFKPEQIKSATGNQGTFDPQDARISFLPASRAGASAKEQANAETLWKTKGVKSPFFKNWFGDWQKNAKDASKAVDATGAPLALYHGSPALLRGGFDAFNVPADASGLLAGTGIYLTDNRRLGQSYTLNRDDIRGGAMIDPANVPANTPVMSLYANIRKPFDAGPQGLAEAERIIASKLPVEEPYMGRNGKMIVPETPAELAKFRMQSALSVYPKNDPLLAYRVLHDVLANEDIIRSARSHPGDDLRPILEAEGFDGIRHVGGVMGGEKHHVWVAFRSEQVKSATANNGKFDTANPSIAFLPGGQSTPPTAQRIYVPSAATPKINFKIPALNSSPPEKDRERTRIYLPR